MRDMANGELAGLQVLVVEDEPLISMLLEDMLDQLGCRVVGPCPTLASAAEAVRGGDFDVALLDLDLAGEQSHGLAQQLAREGRPFAISSGAPQGSSREEWAEEIELLRKPYTTDQLSLVLHSLRRALPCS